MTVEDSRGLYLCLCKEGGVEPQEGVLDQLQEGSRLDLSGQSLSKDTCSVLVSLSDCMLSEEGAKVLLSGLFGDTTVKSLDMNGNNLRSARAEVLGKLLAPNKTLKEAFSGFCDCLGINNTLTPLDLRNNQISPCGAAALVLALRRSGSVEELDLRWNNLGLLGGRSLLEALQSNKSMVRLKVAGNNIPSDTLKALEQTAGHNARWRCKRQQLLQPVHSTVSCFSIFFCFFLSFFLSSDLLLRKKEEDSLLKEEKLLREIQNLSETNRQLRSKGEELEQSSTAELKMLLAQADNRLEMEKRRSKQALEDSEGLRQKEVEQVSQRLEESHRVLQEHILKLEEQRIQDAKEKFRCTACANGNKTLNKTLRTVSRCTPWMLRDALELKIQEEKEAIQQTQQEVCALQQDLQVKQDVTQHKEELKDEPSKLFKLRCELQKLQNTGGDCKLLKHELEVEKTILYVKRQKLKTFKREYEDVTTDVEKEKRDIDTLRTENQALLGEIQALERVVKRKAEAEAELGGLRNESSRLKNSVQRLKVEIQMKKAELQRHSNLIWEGTVSSSDPQALLGAVREEQRVVELLKREATYLKTQLHELELSSTFQGGLRGELRGLLAQKKSAEENNSRLKKKIRQLQEEHKEVIEIRGEVGAQSKALDALNAEEKELEEAYNSIKADIVALGYGKGQLELEKEVLSGQIQEKKKVLQKKGEVEAELCALKEVSSSLKDGIELIKQEIEREKAEFERISESKELPDTLISTLTKKVWEEKFAVENLEQEADVLKRKLQDLKVSVQQKQGVENELRQVSAQKRSAQDNISEMEREITNLQSTLHQYDKINAEVLSESKTLHALHQRQRELEKEQESIQAEISALQVNNSKLAAENQTLSEKLQQQQQLGKKKTEAEEELRALGRVTASLKDSIGTLKQQIKSETAKFGGVFQDGAHEAMPDPSDVFKDFSRRIADQKIVVENLKLEADNLNSKSQEMQELNKQIPLLEKQLLDLDRRKQLLQENVSTTARKISKFQEKKKSYISMNEEVVAKNNELKKLYREQKRVEKEYEAAKTEINAVRASTSKLREDNYILTKKRESSQKRVQKMKKKQPNQGASNVKEPVLKESVSPIKHLKENPPPKNPKLKSPDPVLESSSDDDLTLDDISELPFDTPSLSDF
uniref:Leucine rich repeat containing 45 n=2 Tax=Oryzias latipes TaxID=8090 RepID=A0A3B3I533_ORYLA